MVEFDCSTIGVTHDVNGGHIQPFDLHTPWISPLDLNKGGQMQWCKIGGQIQPPFTPWA